MESNFTSLAFLEAKGLSKCFKAYAENAVGEEIMECGFNPKSGYVYLALEYGIQIASLCGGDVEYIVFDYDTGEEKFFEKYEEAENFLNFQPLDE
jgi:hypothetical protein